MGRGQALRLSESLYARPNSFRLETNFETGAEDLSLFDLEAGDSLFFLYHGGGRILLQLDFIEDRETLTSVAILKTQSSPSKVITTAFPFFPLFPSWLPVLRLFKVVGNQHHWLRSTTTTIISSESPSLRHFYLVSNADTIYFRATPSFFSLGSSLCLALPPPDHPFFFFAPTPDLIFS